MAVIIRDMLFLSRALRGVLARREWVDSLASIAAEVGDYHEAEIVDAGLTLRILGEAAGSFDVGLIKRAISNLLGNATRYANQGTTIVVDISTSEGCAQLVVTNQGERIPPDDLERIFDRFFRVDPSRSDAPTNHGLGLAIVSAIARMHGGHAYENSEANFTSIGLQMTVLEDAHVNISRYRRKVHNVQSGNQGGYPYDPAAWLAHAARYFPRVAIGRGVAQSLLLRDPRSGCPAILLSDLNAGGFKTEMQHPGFQWTRVECWGRFRSRSR